MWWRRRAIEARVQSRSTEDVLQACPVIWISRSGPPTDRVPSRQPSDLKWALPGVRPTAT